MPFAKSGVNGSVQWSENEYLDYGASWVTEIISLTHSAAGGLNGCISLTDVTGETADISEDLDFGFWIYDEVWWADNAGLSPFEPGRWLGVSHRTDRLMTYHILTQRGTVVSRSTVQRVPQLELNTTNVKEIFVKFDAEIHRRLKSEPRVYDGDKPNPQNWADLLEEDEDLQMNLQRFSIILSFLMQMNTL